MKNYINTKSSLLVFLSLSLFVTTSCVDLDLIPYDKVSDAQYWKKENSALLAVNACYTSLMSAEEVLYADAMTDNAYCKVNSINQAIGNGSYSAETPYVLSVWSSKYAGIRSCNLLLDNIDQVPNLTDELKNRYASEAKVIRAYLYFELYSKFGDLPFFTKTISVEESQKIERTPKAVVVDRLLADLNDVILADYLPEKYTGADVGRINRYAAIALKARILLFEGRYAEVKVETEKLLGKFSLFPSYEGLFYAENENNPEVILDIQYMLNTREHAVEYQFIPPSLGGYAQLSPLQELVDSYIATDGLPISESSVYSAAAPYLNRDPRLAATVIYTGNSYTMAGGSKSTINCDKGSSKDGYGFSSDCSATGYYFKKYWDKNHRESLNSGLNIQLIRYADVLLMLAEAAAETGTLDEAIWNKTIKPIRERAGFTLVSALTFPAGKSKQEMIEIVRRERRSEMAFEGLRLKDIIRWKLAETNLNGYCHGLKTNEVVGSDGGYVRVEKRSFDTSKHYLWPIPQSERDLNSHLSQNSNW